MCLENEEPKVIVGRSLHLFLCKRTFDTMRFGNPKKPEFIYRAYLLSFVSKYPNFYADYRTNLPLEFFGDIL